MILFLAFLTVAELSLHGAVPSFPSAISLIEALIAWSLLAWRPDSAVIGLGLALELGAFIAAAMWRDRRGKPR